MSNDANEGGAEVEVRPMVIIIHDPNYLRVHTYPNPADKSVRLAMVEWWRDTDNDTVFWKPIIDKEAMEHDAAMDRAKQFAAENGIPVIYEQCDEADEA